jgi:hypothetical protein
MKKKWLATIGLSLILTGAVCLVGCSSLAPSSGSKGTNTNANTAPATVVYMFNPPVGITGYSAVPTDPGAVVASFSQGGPGQMANDPTGQIYIAGTHFAANQGYVFIYAPNPGLNAVPTRTINLSFFPNRLAADPAGRVYAVEDNVGSGLPFTLYVYSATASGSATPLRTLALTNVGFVEDIAADAAGNIYLAGYFGGQWAIAVYPPTATGASTPARTINFGISQVYGVAVDPAGDIFVNVCPGCYEGKTFAIEEFAPGASGADAPINTISIAIAEPWIANNGGPVRLDGAGNIFTQLELMNTSTSDFNSPIYVFPPTATGSQAPTLQIDDFGDPASPFFAVN